MIRAFIYGIVTGDNDKMLSSDAFLAGCNRFGLDSPCPIITKRLGVFGNTEELEKDFRRMVKKYQDQYPDNQDFKKLDVESVHPTIDFKATPNVPGIS